MNKLNMSNSTVPLSSQKQVTNLAVFSKHNLFRSLFWMKLKFENILSIEAELGGKWSKRSTRLPGVTS